MDIDEIYDTSKVCKLLGISRPTLLREVRAGRLKAFRAGKHLRFLQGDILAYIEAQRVQPDEELDEEEEEEET